MLTDTEQTANALAPLGGVQEPATEGPEETQVAGIVGKAASAIGNAIVPPAARDKMSQGIIKSIMGDTGSALNKARIKSRVADEDALGQSKLPEDPTP